MTGDKACWFGRVVLGCSNSDRVLLCVGTGFVYNMAFFSS